MTENNQTLTLSELAELELTKLFRKHIINLCYDDDSKITKDKEMLLVGLKAASDLDKQTLGLGKIRNDAKQNNVNEETNKIIEKLLRETSIRSYIEHKRDDNTLKLPPTLEPPKIEDGELTIGIIVNSYDSFIAKHK